MTDAEQEQKALAEVRAILKPLSSTYTVEQILGVGSMGYVLLVRHRLFGWRALKLLHPGLLSSRIIRGRFDTEARIMYSLNHPHVVKVHDLSELPDGTPYIVMDFLKGGTLEDHLNEFGSMPPMQAVGVAIAILRGLQAAHGHMKEDGTLDPVFHRDIKPQNILFDGKGVPKIADFGIARVQEGTRSKTHDGSAMGTFAYMAPEQLSGEHRLVDARSDVHAVGVTLYVMLTCGTLGQEAFFRQLEDAPERLEGVLEVLQDVIRKATARDRKDRFPTAAAMADELESILASLPEDPEGTHELGSVPQAQEGNRPVDAPSPGIPPMGLTMVPLVGAQLDPEVATSSEDGVSSASSSGASCVFQLRDPETDQARDQAPLGTIHPQSDEEVERGQIDAIRLEAKRRVMWRVVFPALATLLVLVAVGLGMGFAMRPKPAPPEPVEEVVEIVPEPIESEPTPEPIAAPAHPTQVAPSVVVTSPVVRAKSSTPRVVTTEAPTSEATVQTAQVRLILKPDTTATVILTGDGGTFSFSEGSRDVPQGTYRVSVDMPGRDALQTGSLTVAPGLTVITCDSRFKMCTGLK